MFEILRKSLDWNSIQIIDLTYVAFEFKISSLQCFEGCFFSTLVELLITLIGRPHTASEVRLT